MSILEAQAGDTSAALEDRTVVADDGSSDLRVQPTVAPAAAPRRRTSLTRRRGPDPDVAGEGSADDHTSEVAGHWQDAVTVQMAHVGVHHRP